jgi:hypothetical protein
MFSDVLPYAHNSTASTKISLKLLSFEEIGYTILTRQISALFFLQQSNLFPHYEGKMVKRLQGC